MPICECGKKLFGLIIQCQECKNKDIEQFEDNCIEAFLGVDEFGTVVETLRKIEPTVTSMNILNLKKML